MESRFVFKDFVFMVLFILVIGAVVWVGYQFSYQEGRLNQVKGDLDRLNDGQKQQLAVLTDIRGVLKGGVRAGDIASSATQPESRGTGRIRRTEPDGGIYVYYPDIPSSPRDPTRKPDYATGDWLIQNLGGEPQVIAPFIEKDMQGQYVHSPVLEPLLGQNPETLEWEPALADWYRISADGLRFTFHLRPQICFSDGVPVTADDVLFSFNTLMNEDIDAASLRSYFANTTCRKIDDRTVEFSRKEPYFLALEFIGGAITIIPEHVYKFTSADAFNKRGDLLVGTGQYRVDRWDRGQKITLVRNEKYWGDRPTFDKIVYVFIGNSQAQLQSFLNGQIDLLGDPIPPDAEEFLKYSKDADFLKKFKAYKYTRPNAMYMYIGWNEEKAMFKDKATRTALTMLIDRKAIIHQMVKEMGVEMNGPFLPTSPQSDPSVAIVPYDPQGGKKMLAAAGWKPGPDGVLERDGVKFEFDLSLRTGVPIRERVSTYVQQQLQQAGIRVRLTPYEPSVLIERLDEHNFDACLAGWGAGGAESDPTQIWNSNSIANRGSNHISYRNSAADKLMEEARRTMDDKKRLEIWHRLQRIIYEDQPYLWLYAEVDTAFVNGRFQNTEPYPLGLVEYDTDWYVPAQSQKYH